MKFLAKLVMPIVLSILGFCTTQSGIINQQPNITGAIALTASVDTVVVFLEKNIYDTITGGKGVIGGIKGSPKEVQLFAPGHEIIDTLIAMSDGETTNVDVSFKQVSSGNISISTIVGVSVFVDNLNVGTTVDTDYNITGIPNGEHVIYLSKGTVTATDTVTVLSDQTTSISPKLEASRFTIIEHFSNVSCEGCPEKAEILMQILDSINSMQLIKLSYNAYWPSPQDPMYLAAENDNHARISYYKVAALPYFVINGSVVNYTSNEELHTKLLEAIQTELPQKSDFSISVSQVSADSGSVNIGKLSGSIISTTVRIALEQKLQSYPTPPGTNGETDFHNVFRGYANGENGTLVDFSKDVDQTIAYKFDLTNYKGEELYLIAFLQDNSSKEILQSFRVKLK